MTDPRDPRGLAGDAPLLDGWLRFTARAAWFDAERRLAEAAASGVDAEVVSPFPPLLNYLLPAPFGRDLARWVNEYIASLCRAAPGRIYGLVSLAENIEDAEHNTTRFLVMSREPKWTPIQTKPSSSRIKST